MSVDGFLTVDGVVANTIGQAVAARRSARQAVLACTPKGAPYSFSKRAESGRFFSQYYIKPMLEWS
jgi:hypothetical protein